MVLSRTPGVKQLSSIKQQSQWQLMFERPGTFKNRLQLLVCLRLLLNTSTELVTSYSIPIMRMAWQFLGLTLANYDKAFRRDAASRNITDYSLKWTLSCSSTAQQRFYILRFCRLSLLSPNWNYFPGQSVWLVWHSTGVVDLLVSFACVH